MSFRQVKPSMIVLAKIMGRQAGLNIDRLQGMSTARLEAHFLAGGNVMGVLRAIIAAHRAGIDLDFDRAAAIDLAGRDVLDAVRTSVSPKVIDCPGPQHSGKTTLSAVAKNGVELRSSAPRVTVRTNLLQLIGGATEETIIARVGQGIITAIGSARTHMEVMEKPDRISKGVLDRGLDANTAFAIVSIDIADIDVGENIGARLQADQAEADMRMAQGARRGALRRSDRLLAGDAGQGDRASRAGGARRSPESLQPLPARLPRRPVPCQRDTGPAHGTAGGRLAADTTAGPDAARSDWVAKAPRPRSLGNRRRRTWFSEFSGQP